MDSDKGLLLSCKLSASCILTWSKRTRGAASSPGILKKALIRVLDSGPQEKLSFPPPGELPD